MFGRYTVEGLIRYFCKVYEIQFKVIDSRTIEADGVQYRTDAMPVTELLETIRKHDWKEEGVLLKNKHENEIRLSRDSKLVKHTITPSSSLPFATKQKMKGPQESQFVEFVAWRYSND